MRVLTSLVLLGGSEAAIVEVVSNCSSLKELHFPHGLSISEQNLAKVFKGCSQLANLSITEMGGLQQPLTSLTHLENLESLLVMGNLMEADFTDDIILQLVQKNAKLATLEIRTAGADLTDMGVFRAISASKSLTTLNISRCRALTKNVVSLLANSGSLNLLNVSLRSEVGSPFSEEDARDFSTNSRLKVFMWGARSVRCKYVPWLS